MGEYPRGTFRFKKLCGSLWKGETLRFADYTLKPALSTESGGDRDLGIMLYDMDFSNPKDIKALFYRAEMRHGVIIVPPLKSEEILR